MSLVSVSNYCCLLLFAAGFCCCLLLISAVCSYLLQFASQHESKMTQKASQPLQNGPRNSPGDPKMPSWGLKKTAQERQNSSPRRPWMPSDTPLDSKSEKSIPFWSLFVDWGYPLDALRDPKIDQKSSFCDNGCSKERFFIDLCGKCRVSRFLRVFGRFSMKID